MLPTPYPTMNPEDVFTFLAASEASVPDAKPFNGLRLSGRFPVVVGTAVPSEIGNPLRESD